MTREVSDPCGDVPGRLFDVLLALTVPVVDLLPTTLFESETAHRVTAAATLVVLFLGVGMLASSAIAGCVGTWLEDRYLKRFPPYALICTLSNRLAGRDTPTELQPALLTVADDMQMLVAIVEALSDGRLTVFVPLAPTPGVGHLQIVSPERIERLDTSMASALGWVLDWGMGTESVLGGEGAPARGRG